ncbi:hypothetical protein IJ579_05175 [bacterium]|nr:hypothetical protein [bacterium]
MKSEKLQNYSFKNIKNLFINNNSENKQTEPTNIVKTSTERNYLKKWSIGLGAAATLIALGVVGRKGYLGNGVQKLLKGTKKEAQNLSENLTETIAHQQKAQNIDEEIIQTGLNEHNVRTPKPAAKVLVESNGLSKAEIDAINATFDRSIPKIPSDMFHVDIPNVEEVQKEIFKGSNITAENWKSFFDKEKPQFSAERSYGGHVYNHGEHFYIHELPNGEKIKIGVYVHGGAYAGEESLCAFRRLDKNNKELFSIEYYSGGEVNFVNIGNLHFEYGSYPFTCAGCEYIKSPTERFYYGENGDLRRLLLEYEEKDIDKEIFFHKNSTDIRAIVYRIFEPRFKYDKIEVFENNRIVQEIYNTNEETVRYYTGFYED